MVKHLDDASTGRHYGTGEQMVGDADGRFTATFYNNGKPTRMKVSAVGLTDEGQPVYYK